MFVAREIKQKLRRNFFWTPCRELVKPERNILQVSIKDTERHNSMPAVTSSKEYYHVYPYLCAAVKTFVKDQVLQALLVEKDFFLSLK